MPHRARRQAVDARPARRPPAPSGCRRSAPCRRAVAAQDVDVQRVEGVEVLVARSCSGRSARTRRPSGRRVRRSRNAGSRPDISGRRTLERPCRSASDGLRAGPSTATRAAQGRAAPMLSRPRRRQSRSRARSRLRGLRRVPPPDRRERRTPYSGSGSGLREAVPARGADLAGGPLRHDVDVATAARGRAPWWRRPGRRGPWRR